MFTYNKHKFSPESVRFIGDDLIVSAGKDMTIHLLDLEGNQKDMVTHEAAFSSLAVISKEGQKGFAVASDVQANIMLY